MAELSIFSFLVGIVLGQHFRVIVLLPVMLALGLFTLALTAHLPFPEGLTRFGLCALALQGGYFLGAIAS